jgi:membrane-bound lytic murein transglycosylase F
MIPEDRKKWGIQGLPAWLLLPLWLFLSACSRQALPFPEAGEELVALTYAGPLTYDAEGGTPTGFEHDLVRMFADELGVPVRFVVVPRHEIHERLLRHEAHLAAGWFSPAPGKSFVYSAPFLSTSDVLVRHEDALPLRDPAQLEGQIVVAQGSRQYRALRALQKQTPHLEVRESRADTPLDLLADVASRKVEIALVDQAVVSIGQNYYPTLQAGLEVGEAQPIVWIFPADGDPRLHEQAQAFIVKTRDDRALAILRDRYLGHLERLRPQDVMVFIERIKSRLPKYRALFQQAQQETGIDWRLLAALSYQESHWNPLNTSPTGVRGIMMLTEETADRLGVSNRLDPNESIIAGARYVNLLKSYIPESTPEPDRTWQALAAYNIGPGHFNAARRLAGRKGVNGDSWFEMKKILPLLARPEYYANLKSGRARGGEAVILVENVRLFYDILLRHQPEAGIRIQEPDIRYRVSDVRKSALPSQPSDHSPRAGRTEQRHGEHLREDMGRG